MLSLLQELIFETKLVSVPDPDMSVDKCTNQELHLKPCCFERRVPQESVRLRRGEFGRPETGAALWCAASQPPARTGFLIQFLTRFPEWSQTSKNLFVVSNGSKVIAENMEIVTTNEYQKCS